MGSYKGVGVLFVRKRVRELSARQQAEFRQALTESERSVFDRTMATEWVDINHATRFFEVLGAVAYSHHRSPVRAVGVALAKHDLSGVYRYLVRMTTVNFLLAQHARLWSTYHREGRCSLSHPQPKRGQIRVEGYPHLPATFRECTAGWLEGALQVCGAKNVVVEHDVHASAQGGWVWDLAWM